MVRESNNGLKVEVQNLKECARDTGKHIEVINGELGDIRLEMATNFAKLNERMKVLTWLDYSVLVVVALDIITRWLKIV